MLNYRLCSLCGRSIVLGWSVTGGTNRRYRSIPSLAVLSTAQILIRARRPLLPAVVRLRCSPLTVERRTFFSMASADTSDPGSVLKIVAASVCIADRAGGIVRNIMSAGNLGIVEKV